MKLPDFFIIGAAKAGTTSIHALLDKHPDIYMSKTKEPEFFARDELYNTGLEDYAKFFADAAPGQIAGEASTIYSLSPLFPQTAKRIAAHTPEAKFIYVMRQPVERAYSYYVQIVKNYQNITSDLTVGRSFEDFIDPDFDRVAVPRETMFSAANDHLPDIPELCLAGGEYLQQIEAYLAHFSRDQFLFLKFEDFTADRAATLQKITDFLGVSPLGVDVFEQSGVTLNVSANHFRRWSEQVSLNRARRLLGPIWALRNALPTGMRQSLRGRLLATSKAGLNHKPAAMTQDTRDKLTARYSAQQDRLEKLTGLDFADWWR